MTMILLDTNVVSELTRAEPDEAVVDWLDAQPVDQVFLTSIVMGEISYGIARLPSGRRKDELADRIEAILTRQFRGAVVAYTEASARAFGPIMAFAESKGRPMGVADAQIAAIAAERGATLATRNTRDFATVDIGLVNPWQFEG